jgi:hypothetical protein
MQHSQRIFRGIVVIVPYRNVVPGRVAGGTMYPGNAEKTRPGPRLLVPASHDSEKG